MHRTALAALLLLPLAGCGFDHYDGRWVADVPPRHDCCPLRLSLDVDGHNIAGTVEDCQAVLPVKGKLRNTGDASLTVDGKPATLRFAGEDFQTVLPSDRCHRPITGNRGG